MTTEQNVIFDRFLNEVAPKLDAASANTCVLTAEEVVLTVAGLDLAAAITAEAKGISLESARSEVFAPHSARIPMRPRQERDPRYRQARTGDHPRRHLSDVQEHLRHFVPGGRSRPQFDHGPHRHQVHLGEV